MSHCDTRHKKWLTISVCAVQMLGRMVAVVQSAFEHALTTILHTDQVASTVNGLKRKHHLVTHIHAYRRINPENVNLGGLENLITQWNILSSCHETCHCVVD